MQLSIVIPTYNEVENLPKLIPALFALPLDALSVLVIDDNSRDGTGQVAEELAAAYHGRLSVIHREGKMGLGTAYITGFRQVLESGAEAIAQMDADFSHPPEKLPDLLETLQTCDVAIGSRYVEGGGVDEGWPLWRKGLSAFGNLYSRLILGFPLQDATGGYRIWRRETLERMPLERIRSNGYAFQIETIYVAYRLGYTIREVPFYFADRRWGKSKMSLNIQIEAAIRVWQIRFWHRRLKPLKPV